MIRVVLPFHLRTLARIQSEVQLEVEGPISVRTVLDALEARFPMLRGQSATMSRSTAVHLFASTRANKICRMTRRTIRCREQWPAAKSHYWSWGH